MGKQAPKLVVAALIVAVLVILALQNSSPALALVFLGLRTVPLPLGVWLTAAIALGALTTLVIAALTGLNLPPASRSNRRRWTVRPDPPPADSGPDRERRSWNVRSPQEPPRRDPPPRDTQRREPPRESPRDRDYGRAEPVPPLPNTVAAAEDWQSWGQRNSPNKWEDWSQATGNDPINENLSRQQRQDREKAEATIHDLDKGWDESAQETVYVAPGGSDVEDALDDIVDGWEDWDSPDNPLTDTAYAQRYEGVERKARRDAIYAPPDEADDEYEEWENLSDQSESDDAENGDSSVYDADYRVIIPPYRPLDETGNEGDRAP